MFHVTLKLLRLNSTIYGMGYQLDKRQFEILDMLSLMKVHLDVMNPLQDEIETLLKQLDFSIQREQLYDNDSVSSHLKRAQSKAPKLILNGHVDGFCR